MDIEQRGPGTGARMSESIELSLDTLERTRIDLAEVTKAYMAGEIADTPFRAFVYACNSITKLLVHAKAKELETRIKALERSQSRSQ